MIGHQLGGRYEIESRVGGGGMAIVYKGHDVLLHRKVAVKILRQQFVHDEDFIRRFRREAQSAASLSHPNVVSIYDVGKEDDIHFIVMEYIEGSNLNEIIKERAPIQVGEAVHIASQICDALEHAHANQIIHRDIKPHNILIGKNGRVKVTDFGIARAAASSDITQTGSVIGSVHYFSPEHAKGVSQGEKSDIYSLGIVLYQMLTNRLPFLGESPISVALKHLQEDVEEPRKVNSLIPQSVENIILKSMRKKPEERYESAAEMLRDLETCLSESRLHEPKLTFETDLDEEATRIMPAIRADKMPASRMDSEDQDDQEERWAEVASNKRSSWLKPVIWSTTVVLMLVLMWVGVEKVKATFEIPEVDVPTVIDMPFEEAKALLENEQLEVPPPEEIYDEADKGIVIDQNKQNMKVKEGSSILLTVSLGEELTTMGDYIDKPWTEVEADLKRLGFEAEQIEKEEIISEDPAGTVIMQNPLPNSEFVLEDTKAVIKVSKGLDQFKTPNLIGLKLSVAEAILIQHDLKLASDEIREVPSYTIPEGHVVEQWPFDPDSMISAGQTLRVSVSTGFPEAARFPTKLVTVEPVEDGLATQIRIMINDAKGNDREWGVREITETTTYPIDVVLSPDKNALISVYRNEQLYDTHTVTYKEAEQQLEGGEVSEGPDE